MVISRTDGFVRRSGGALVRGCCCANECYSHTGTLYRPSEALPPVPEATCVGTCLRAFVWKSETWTGGASQLNGWVSGWKAPDFVLRIARLESTNGGRFCGGPFRAAQRYEGFPVTSPCWDFNPTTGQGTYNLDDLETAIRMPSGQYTLPLFPASLRAWLDARSDKTFAVGMLAEFYSYAWNPRPGFGWDNYGGPCVAGFVFYVLNPSASMRAEIDNAAYPIIQYGEACQDVPEL